MDKLRQGITGKIFLITSLLLFVSALLIFSLFYFLLPSYYYQYKTNRLENGFNVLKAQVASIPVTEAQETLDTFAEQYNVGLLIVDLQGNVIYHPPAYIKLKRLPADLLAPSLQVRFRSGETKERIYTAQKPLTFLDGTYIAFISATLQPIDEASDAIFMFMPYVVLIILLISLGGALLYAKVISQPLLRINRVAKRMAQLDFSEKCEEGAQDEIGELSRSLNELSRNLEATMSDLTKANAQLKDDIQREREQEAKRREFLATISHELKSPITAVMGQLEGMIHNIGAYRDRDKYLQRSYAIMQGLRELVNEILELSKLEMVGMSLKLEPISLSDLVEKVIKRFDYFSSSKQINLQTDIQPAVNVKADSTWLEKAISNVIDNAIKYAPEEATVTVSLTDTDDGFCLRVHNTGTHIEESQIERLFQAFTRLEKSRNRSTGGSGLGLFIVKRILEVHRFPYQLTNDEGGVLFTIRFPASSSPD
ncbi:sensor histidine kinase [Paenactinomyces guangxiensis]|uniref:histidine kinase n=1 Tax=Paenactinomyces guangxiensis TaxID=1490290 RepID=A0A7W2AAD8_9BACL|nr:HAMP domain-containing sensor histidine kinase [Paenactinomyces guangxiensis]MBA4496099.1 HAMP domain-containing histidine kinase [Paenactinomyces guangxiensis]MBH8593186.1 HAMP domain-containing histidine kinase [Paenactinomyces guangxiensis]